ncbi:MAG: DUF4382 domain-containing protein [Pseudomonadales bacterium]|nr:DUF4382 domain-containing protein [Pseudomonadales bacterium]
MTFQYPINIQRRLLLALWLSRGLRFLSVAVFTFIMAGCGGGSGGSETGEADTSGDQGQLALALTDAEGDFVTYAVDVTSITLEKSNGTTVETVPLHTRVDFAQYTDMTEFFTLRTLPAGNYTKIHLNLDYSNAAILIQDETGAQHLASAVDSDGEVISAFRVSVSLPQARLLRIRKGIPASLTLDFDLDSSNTILSYEPAIVEVEPFILASVELDSEREHRARGLLKSVDTIASTFNVALKPFAHRQGDFGGIAIHSQSSTHYDINGDQYQGEYGLEALQTLSVDTPLLVYGQVSENLQFNALYVIAGTSVPWVGRDSARGIVIAREGNQVTLRGSYHDQAAGSVVVYDDIHVNLGENTTISRQALTNEGLTSADVSIGQRLVVFGEMRGDLPGEYRMDASEGHVRMLMNLIKGEVVSLSPLVVDLRWINGRRMGLFDFSGTGSAADNDSNPNAYQIATGSLSLADINLGSLVKVRGYPVAFGSTPEDFSAQTVIDINTEQRAAAMNVIWLSGGSDSPFIAINSDALILDVSEAHYQVKLAGVPLDFFDGLETDPMVSSLSHSGRGLYGIKVAGEPAIQIFNDFTQYNQALMAQLNNGRWLRRMVGVGRYNQLTDDMSAVVVTARFR